MKWYVYYYNINKRKIDIFNIFEHGSFCEYIKYHAQICKTKEDFIERLKSELLYYFWSKAEWEVIIAPWCGGDREKDSVKVDVYDQIMNNFEVFADYVWNNKEELLNN